MSTVDLNSDLGEGFGRWAVGDDDALRGWLGRGLAR